MSIRKMNRNLTNEKLLYIKDPQYNVTYYCTMITVAHTKYCCRRNRFCLFSLTATL